MRDILDLANCASPDSVLNTGVPLCDLAKKKMKAVIFADKGVRFSGAQIQTVAAFIIALKAATVAPRGQRVYPIWDMLNFEDSTGDPATGSIGNLTTATIITSDAIPAFRFGYNGSEARHKRLAALAASSVDVFFVDEQWAIYGTDRNGAFGGFSVIQAYAYTSKFIVGDAVNQYSFHVTLGSIAEYRDQSRYVVANSGILAATGLINVELQKLSNATNVYKIQPIADGGTNLATLYGAALAAMTFTAKNLQTGAALAVTSVAYDSTPGAEALTVTFDNTAYSALNVGDLFQLSGPSAATLATGNIKPFEIMNATFVK